MSKLKIKDAVMGEMVQMEAFYNKTRVQVEISIEDENGRTNTIVMTRNNAEKLRDWLNLKLN